MSVIENDKDMLVLINICLLLQIFITYFCEKIFIDTVKNLKILSLKVISFAVTKPSM